jgi:hypothetical protein
MFAADPKLRDSMLGVVSSSLGEEDKMSPAERLLMAQQLYEESQDPQKLQERVLAEKFTAQLPNLKTEDWVAGREAAVPGLREFVSSQPDEVQKALAVVQDPKLPDDLRKGANAVLTKYGITPETMGQMVEKYAGNQAKSDGKSTAFDWGSAINSQKTDMDKAMYRKMQDFSSQQSPEIAQKIELVLDKGAGIDERKEAIEFLSAQGISVSGEMAKVRSEMKSQGVTPEKLSKLVERVRGYESQNPK